MLSILVTDSLRTEVILLADTITILVFISVPSTVATITTLCFFIVPLQGYTI